MKQYIKLSMTSIGSAAFGAAIVVGTLKYIPSFRAKFQNSNSVTVSRDSIDDILGKQKSIQQDFDSLFKDDFFGKQDPFEEMRKMREQMERRMKGFGSDTMSNPFDSWFSHKFGGGTANDISKREDYNYVYYDIKIDNVKSISINTKVENGYITITGSTEKKSESTGNSGENIFESSFTRTFPLPENVDANKMQTTTEENKIVLKFPKVHA